MVIECHVDRGMNSEINFMSWAKVRSIGNAEHLGSAPALKSGHIRCKGTAGLRSYVMVQFMPSRAFLVLLLTVRSKSFSLLMPQVS